MDGVRVKEILTTGMAAIRGLLHQRDRGGGVCAENEGRPLGPPSQVTENNVTTGCRIRRSSFPEIPVPMIHATLTTTTARIDVRR